MTDIKVTCLKIILTSPSKTYSEKKVKKDQKNGVILTQS